MVGARYAVWRVVAAPPTPVGRAAGYRAAVATVPSVVGGLWALVWSHERPVLAGTVAFAVVWATAFLGGTRRD